MVVSTMTSILYPVVTFSGFAADELHMNYTPSDNIKSVIDVNSITDSVMSDYKYASK